MKKNIIATAVAMLLSTATHADSTAVLKLKGVLTNDACTPTLSDGGIVDFGTNYVSALSATADNQLGHKDITLTIACTAATKVAWTINDNNADSVKKLTIEDATFTGNEAWSSTVEFGVGKTAGNVNIGAYSVAMNRNITVDGGAKQVGLSSDGVAWAPADSDAQLLTHSSGLFMFSAMNIENNDLVPFTNAVFPLRVALAVQKTDALAITDDTPITGQATITLRYL